MFQTLGEPSPYFTAFPLPAFVLSLLHQICPYLTHPRLPSGTTEFSLQVQILPGKATLFLEAASSSSGGQLEQAQRAEALVHRDTVPAERNFKNGDLLAYLSILSQCNHPQGHWSPHPRARSHQPSEWAARGHLMRQGLFFPETLHWKGKLGPNLAWKLWD